MNPKITVILKFLKVAGLWVMGFFYEIPFAIALGVVFQLLGPYPVRAADFLAIGWFVWAVSLACRFISLHFVGSALLRWFLSLRGANPCAFGLADFLLANLWVGIWAWFFPDGIASMLFHDIDGGPFQLTVFWWISIPPIGLGSFVFQLVRQKTFFSKFKGSRAVFQ